MVWDQVRPERRGGAQRHALGRFGPVTYTISATTQPIQVSSYNAMNGLETESTSDNDGGYDVGYSSDGSWAEFRNVDFGSGVSSVNVRVASAGSGGTLEFHLDSLRGPLIGTVTLPVTGGWQNWTNVSTPVSGAARVHNLFLVEHSTGSGGIANLNWFQFQ